MQAPEAHTGYSEAETGPQNAVLAHLVACGAGLGCWLHCRMHLIFKNMRRGGGL